MILYSYYRRTTETVRFDESAATGSRDRELSHCGREREREKTLLQENYAHLLLTGEVQTLVRTAQRNAYPLNFTAIIITYRSWRGEILSAVTLIVWLRFLL